MHSSFFCFSRSNNSNCPCCPPIPRPRCPTSSTSLRPSKSHALTITCPTSDWWATGCSDPTPTRAYVHMVQTSFIPSSFSCCPRRPFSAPLPPYPQLQILNHILLVKETRWTGEEYTQQEREKERSTHTQRKRKIFLQQERSTLQEEKEKFLHSRREILHCMRERELRAVYRKAEINKSRMEILPYPSLPTHVVERGRSTHGEKKACFAFVNHPLSEKELHTGTLHTHKSKQPDGKKCKG